MPVSSIEVDRPPQQVFAYVTDPSRFAEWQDGVVSGHMDEDGRHGPGAHCVTVRRIGFTERPTTAEVTHTDPPRTWGVRGVDGTVRARVSVTVDPLDTGQRSRLAIDVEFEGHGIGKVLVPLIVRPQARREMPRNLRRLKELLESSAVPGPDS